MHKLNLDQPTTSTQPQVYSSLPTHSPVDELPPTTHTINSLPMTAQKGSMARSSKLFPVLGLVAILAGVATGYGGFKLQVKASPTNSAGDTSGIQQVAKAGSIKKGDVFGSNNTTFKDSAEGYLEAGGMDGEGSHKLLRPGGDSQTVYLTSSVTDLDKFVGMEVKINGETFKGQKVGWLMDVGRVEVINPQGQAPSEE